VNNGITLTGGVNREDRSTDWTLLTLAGQFPTAALIGWTTSTPRQRRPLSYSSSTTTTTTTTISSQATSQRHHAPPPPPRRDRATPPHSSPLTISCLRRRLVRRAASCPPRAGVNSWRRLS